MLVACKILFLSAERVAEDRLVPIDIAMQRFSVRVDEELVRVTAMAIRRVVRSVHAVAVPLAGLGRGEVAVPHEGVDVDERNGCPLLDSAR